MRPALSLTDTNLPLYVIAISFVASTFAPLAFRKFDSLAGSIMYLLINVALGYPVASLISGGSLSSERILFLVILGGLSGAFLHHASKERDFTVPFGTAMVMWLFSFDYPLPELQRILLICIFALVLGIGAYWAKAADSDAVLSETIVCLLVILFAGLSWFILLLAFYLLGGAFTRYGYSHKHKLGIAQSHGGVRGYKNVYSNSLVPLALAICYGVYSSDVFIYAFIASVATANGDTLASEIGETSRSKPRMITTLKQTEPGVDGGVTSSGRGRITCRSGHHRPSGHGHGNGGRFRHSRRCHWRIFGNELRQPSGSNAAKQGHFEQQRCEPGGDRLRRSGGRSPLVYPADYLGEVQLALMKIFGIFGDPIEHSLSPAMQNAALRALGEKACYHAFRVARRGSEGCPSRG